MSGRVRSRYWAYGRKRGSAVCVECVHATVDWRCREYMMPKNSFDHVTGDEPAFGHKWCAVINTGGQCHQFQAKAEEIAAVIEAKAN